MAASLAAPDFMLRAVERNYVCDEPIHLYRLRWQ